MQSIVQIPVKINDVTLREWDQAPLTSFIADEKKLIALMLNEIWVNAMEVWFASSRADFENVRGVVEIFIDDTNQPTITSLGRAVKEDTEASLRALEWYKKGRIHIVMATSDQHIEAKFPGKWETKEERRAWVMKAIVENISLVKKYKNTQNPDLEIEFSPEDATGNALTRKADGKTYLDFQSEDFEYLIEVIRSAIQAGANIINTPDTLWNLLPHQSEKFFQELVRRTDDLRENYTFEFSTHIHNDMASATNGAIAGIRGWARQIELTTAWIGERTWNTSLHETVGIIENSGHQIVEDAQVIFSRPIQTQLIGPVTRAVERIVWLNKLLQTPFIWALSDVDGSWIHTAAVSVYGGTKNKAHFGGQNMEEFFSPRSWANQIVHILKDMYGVNVDKNSDTIQKVTERACIEAETIKALYPARIYTLYLEEAQWLKTEDINIHGNSVNIKLKISWKEVILKWTGTWENGIIDATIHAINNYLWTEIVDVVWMEIKNKPSLKKVYETFIEEVWKTNVELTEKFKQRVETVLGDNKNWQGSEQVGIVHMVLKVNGKERNIRVADQNTDEATIKAILYWSMEEIMRK